jgi:hypothetical protein
MLPIFLRSALGEVIFISPNVGNDMGRVKSFPTLKSAYRGIVFGLLQD